MNILSDLKQQLLDAEEKAKKLTTKLDDALKKLPVQEKELGTFTKKLEEKKQSERQITK